MEVINDFLQSRGIYSLVMILFFLGVYGMVFSKNYMKKLMAMNVMQVAVIYFIYALRRRMAACCQCLMELPITLTPTSILCRMA